MLLLRKEIICMHVVIAKELFHFEIYQLLFRPSATVRYLPKEVVGIPGLKRLDRRPDSSELRIEMMVVNKIE